MGEGDDKQKGVRGEFETVDLSMCFSFCFKGTSLEGDPGSLFFLNPRIIP